MSSHGPCPGPWGQVLVLVLVVVLGGQVLVLVLGGQVLVLLLVLGGQALVLVLVLGVRSLLTSLIQTSITTVSSRIFANIKVAALDGPLAIGQRFGCHLCTDESRPSLGPVIIYK